MRLVSAACAALSLMVALVACDAGSAPPRVGRATESTTTDGVAVPPTAAPVAAPSLVGSDPLAGLDCEAPRPGWARACTAPGHTITGTAGPCTADSASFGVVSGGTSVAARDRLGPGAREVATFASGQFVCIQYVADPSDGEGERWLHVTAISPDTVSACRTAKCGDPSARSRWNDSARAGECTARATEYSAGCPAGWVPAIHIDEHSMGLGGTHAEG